MNIILLYGAGEVGKRNYLLKIKKEFSSDQISQVDLKQDNISDLELKISSGSLFESGERLIMVENVPDKMDLENLKKLDGGVTLVLVAGHPSLASLILQSAKKLNAKIYSFEGEKELNVFPFLDNLIERKKEAFVELEKLLSEYGAMYILTMIYYLLRRNILPLPSSDFMKKKIQKQKMEFSLKNFEKFYFLTLQTEFKIKSGLTEEKVALTSLVRNFI
ncbi:MAG: hypothetical protein Q7R43_02120 [Candidatus Daviesbacteria bacterium]|nr:hypothetical protein [Candidatus Daviesbacteria bacterium]